MNNRQRKKWLKQHKLYVEPKETWCLDKTLAMYIIPRLKKFKEISYGYPNHEDIDSLEKWNDILDKMILAFEYSIDLDEYWIDNPEYDYMIYTSNDDSKICEKIIENKNAEDKRRLVVINEGLELFAKYYLGLWW